MVRAQVRGSVKVESVGALLHHVQEKAGEWEHVGNVRPWFRGQSDAGKPPLPSVFRAAYDEFWLTSKFRLSAPAFGLTPETERLDQWLFLMQHYGVPTRLLDWTESPLLACFFAVAQWMESGQSEENYESEDMAVWMLHPIELNRLTKVNGEPISSFPNTWTRGNVGSENMRIAFHKPTGRARLMESGDLQPSELPLAIQASAVDRRVTVQRSCFTVHGTDERDFEQLLQDSLRDKYFFKFLISRQRAAAFLHELDALGISFSTVYPDFAGLAKELRLRFGPRPSVVHCAACGQRNRSDAVSSNN